MMYKKIIIIMLVCLIDSLQASKSDLHEFKHEATIALITDLNTNSDIFRSLVTMQDSLPHQHSAHPTIKYSIIVARRRNIYLHSMLQKVVKLHSIDEADEFTANYHHNHKNEEDQSYLTLATDILEDKIKKNNFLT